MEIKVLTHSSIRIEDRDTVIYIDPFRVQDAVNDADYIFVTHDHSDHFSPRDIEKTAKSDTILFVPEKMEGKAQEAAAYVGAIKTVASGTAGQEGSLRFETVPAYNVHKPFHPKKAGWVGYILHIGGKRVYIAGDTDATDEAKAVKCDIALVPVGGKFTMDAEKAAELVNAIRPETAMPTHYGSIVGKEEDAEVFASLVKEPVKVEICCMEG